MHSSLAMANCSVHKQRFHLGMLHAAATAIGRSLALAAQLSGLHVPIMYVQEAWPCASCCTPSHTREPRPQLGLARPMGCPRLALWRQCSQHIRHSIPGTASLAFTADLPQVHAKR